MQGKVEAATRRLLRSKTLLEYRRLNWRVETIGRLSSGFAAFSQAARAAGFPMHISVGGEDVPNGGIVSLSFGEIDTEAPIRKLLPFFFDEDHVDRPIREDGGRLVASQSVEGYVFFMSYPRKSEWMKPTDESLIIGGPIEPTTVSAKLIQKMVRRHLIVLRKSSLYGGNGSLSCWERWVYRGIIFRELRNRYTFYRSLVSLTNEWGKAVVAAVFAAAVGLVAAALASPSCCKPCERGGDAASSS